MESGDQIQRCFMVLIYGMVKWNPKLAPPTQIRFNWKERFVSLKDSWGIGVLGFTVIGGVLNESQSVFIRVPESSIAECGINTFTYTCTFTVILEEEI